MAKEFKDFDMLYAKYIDSYYGDPRPLPQLYELSSIGKWMFAYGIQKWTNDQIRHAVYLSESANEWQKFRVSLKGQSTQVKLARLEMRYVYKVLNASYADRELEHCRIDNYIGALVRGGQLDKEYRILK